MPFAKITGSGLAAIACAVAALWACILGERITFERAYAERAAVMRSLRPGTRRSRPAGGQPFRAGKRRLAAG